jgi:hypothetical protein
MMDLKHPAIGLIACQVFKAIYRMEFLIIALVLGGRL